MEHYKLAIQSIGLGGRAENASWLYFPGGYIKLLAVVRAIWVGPLTKRPYPMRSNRDVPLSDINYRDCAAPRSHRRSYGYVCRDHSQPHAFQFQS
jgi:hypothetical protein